MTPPGGAAGATELAVRLVETLALRGGFNTNLVLISTGLLGLAGGVVGVFALLRKRSLVSDAIGHATLPGICLGFIVAVLMGGSARSLPLLLVAAALSGVAGVWSIAWLLRHTRLREDAAIGAVLSVFFGVGVVGLSLIQGNDQLASQAAGLNKFIYGQAAAMRWSDAWLMGGVAAIGVACTLAMTKELVLVSFNAAFAQAGGWSVRLIDTVLMALIVVVTVSGLQAVGLILVVAMLIIPAVSARLWTERVWVLLILGGGLGFACAYVGTAISATVPDRPTGAVIVLVSGGAFFISLLFAPRRGVLSTVTRRTRQHLRMMCDHVLVEAESRSGRLSQDELRTFARLQGWPGWTLLMLGPMLVVGGLARRSDGSIDLTEGGIARGRRIARNRALWTQYLISYAEIAPGHVDWSVDRVEHVLSDELVRELEEKIGTQAAMPGGSEA